MRVTESILKFQRDFFDKGTAHLKPLILRDVAEDIGMHESTVSRVTTNKYVHTPQGIYELKYFFNSGISRTDGDDLASEAVKLKIKQIIGSESPKHPHSDQRIVELLKDQNIEIARRTVAKYREQLRILSSSQAPPGFLTPGFGASLPLALRQPPPLSKRSASPNLPIAPLDEKIGVKRPCSRRRGTAVIVLEEPQCSSRPRFVTWMHRRRCGSTRPRELDKIKKYFHKDPIAAHAVFAVERGFNHVRRPQHHAAERHRHQRQGDDRGHVLLDRPGDGAHRAPGAQVEGEDPRPQAARRPARGPFARW